jgi:ABC-2 type transport system permease protein
VQSVLIGLGIAVVLPIMALVIGASVLGSEIDDGTVVHILAKPLPRSEIVLSKLLVAVLVTVAAVGPAMLLAGLIAGSGRLGVGLLAGTVAGALAYNALFLLLSLLTRRPVLIGLIYVLVWEGLLTNLLTGTRVLSIQHHAIAVADRVADSPWFAASVSLPVALAATAVITVGATGLAVDRLRSFAGLATRT